MRGYSGEYSKYYESLRSKSSGRGTYTPIDNFEIEDFYYKKSKNKKSNDYISILVIQSVAAIMILFLVFGVKYSQNEVMKMYNYELEKMMNEDGIESEEVITIFNEIMDTVKEKIDDVSYQ